MVLAHTVQQSKIAPIKEVSVGEDFGWRLVNPARVKELVDAFLRDEYGVTSLLEKLAQFHVCGVGQKSSDGNWALMDGKHAFTALLEISALYDSEEGREKHEWSPKLVDALEQGGDVSVVNFKDSDADAIRAYVVTMHNQESNKFKTAALQDMAEVAKRFQKNGSRGRVARGVEKGSTRITARAAGCTSTGW